MKKIGKIVLAIIIFIIGALLICSVAIGVLLVLSTTVTNALEANEIWKIIISCLVAIGIIASIYKPITWLVKKWAIVFDD